MGKKYVVRSGSGDPSAFSSDIVLMNPDGQPWNLESHLPERLSEAFETRNAAALRRWNAALSNIATAPANIAFVGHSMMEGYSATITSERVADSTISALRRKMGITGGLGHKKSIKFFGATDYPITIGGTKLAVGDAGFGGGSAAILGAPYGPATIAIPAGTTSVDLVWTRKTDLGSFTWVLDGGAASSPVSTTGATYGYNTTNIVTNPATGHTLVVTGSSGFVQLGGVTFYSGDETKGIRSWEAGRPGSTSTQYLAAMGPGNNWLDFFNSTNPALIVFTILCNDFYKSAAPDTNNVPTATSKTNIKSIIDMIAARCATRPSVVLCVENVVHEGLNNQPEKWADYVKAAYDLAGVEGYAVFDFNKRLGLTTTAVPGVTAGLINPDKIHPSNAGHRLWGEGLATFLAPH